MAVPCLLINELVQLRCDSIKETTSDRLFLGKEENNKQTIKLL